MKKNMFRRIALLALALVLVVGMIPATSASAVNESEVVSCPHLTFTADGAPDGYDGVTVGDVYEGYSYTLDLDFLLDGVDLDEFLKENNGETTLGFTFGSTRSDFKARISYRLHGDVWMEYPHTKWNSVVEYLQTIEVYDSTPINNAADLRNWKIDVKFDLKGETPGTYYLELLLRGKKWVEKKIKINLKKAPEEAEIKNIFIHDFDFPGVHASAMDKDAWCDAGKMVSIRYLEENMQTERTKLMAGDTGWVEFTIETQGKTKFAYGATTDLISRYNNNFHNISPGSAQKEQVSDYLCKFYHHYEIADDEKYVIKRGTVNLTAPEAGAQASSKVELTNVDFFIVRNIKRDKFTAEEDSAIWLNLDRRGKWKTVTSFSALNTYQALVKLEPRGNYYFNADSVAAMKVPGAEKFTIKYCKAGDLDGIVKEDGWYLRAIFPVVQPKTFDLSIGYDKPDMTVNQNDRAFLTATSSCDLTKASDVSVQWYYSKDPSKDPNGELCGASDGDLKIQLETATVGTGYYKCVISCTVDGKTAEVSYPGGEWAKVTVKKAPEPTQKPTEPTQKPTEPTQKPTEPTQKPTEPTQKPTEPTTPPPTEPVSTDPNPTDPVSTDPNPTDPVSTDPVSTDPVSTDPEATTPDSQPTTDPSGPVPQPTTPAPTGSGGHGGNGSENGGSGILQLWWLWLLLLLLIAAAVTFCIVKKRNADHQEGETT